MKGQPPFCPGEPSLDEGTIICPGEPSLSGGTIICRGEPSLSGGTTTVLLREAVVG